MGIPKKSISVGFNKLSNCCWHSSKNKVFGPHILRTSFTPKASCPHILRTSFAQHCNMVEQHDRTSFAQVCTSFARRSIPPRYPYIFRTSSAHPFEATRTSFSCDCKIVERHSRTSFSAGAHPSFTASAPPFLKLHIPCTFFSQTCIYCCDQTFDKNGPPCTLKLPTPDLPPPPPPGGPSHLLFGSPKAPVAFKSLKGMCGGCADDVPAVDLDGSWCFFFDEVAVVFVKSGKPLSASCKQAMFDRHRKW